jgi:hypothetical protein
LSSFLSVPAHVVILVRAHVKHENLGDIFGQNSFAIHTKQKKKKVCLPLGQAKEHEAIYDNA